MIYRDSEDSAPAEYPPEQPEADVLDDDGVAYGAEEAELQAALERELEDTEAKLATIKAEEPVPVDGDAEMAGTDDVEPTRKPAAEDEEGSEAGSEDLEAESSGSDDDEEEEEGEGEGEVEGEGDGDEDMEMGDGEGEGKPVQEGAATNGERKAGQQARHPEVMVH